MRYHLRVTSRVALIGLMLTGMVCWSGCKRSSEESSSEASISNTSSDTEEPAAPPSGSSSVSTLEQTRYVKPVMPEVKLTESFAKTCLVKVGDTMPDATLNDLQGQSVSLSSLAGEKLTVVCFWKVKLPPYRGQPPYPNDELRQLQTYIVGPYAAKGVQAIAINEDDPAYKAADEFHKERATYPCLLDPRGAYFARIATQGVPRVYLLDPTGKVLWFDIEFSRSTLRDLEQAIRFVLEQNEKPEGE